MRVILCLVERPDLGKTNPAQLDDEIFYAVKKRCEERPKDKVSEATLWIISNILRM